MELTTKNLTAGRSELQYKHRTFPFFFVKIYLQDVNTHTSAPDSRKLFLVNQFTCRTLAVRGGHGATSLPRQVMGGTAVKKWHKRKNTAAEGYVSIKHTCSVPETLATSDS
jgi:hypothetical protein